MIQRLQSENKMLIETLERERGNAYIENQKNKERIKMAELVSALSDIEKTSNEDCVKFIARQALIQWSKDE